MEGIGKGSHDNSSESIEGDLIIARLFVGIAEDDVFAEIY